MTDSRSHRWGFPKIAGWVPLKRFTGVVEECLGFRAEGLGFSRITGWGDCGVRITSIVFLRSSLRPPY